MQWLKVGTTLVTSILFVATFAEDANGQRFSPLRGFRNCRTVQCQPCWPQQCAPCQPRYVCPAPMRVSSCCNNCDGCGGAGCGSAGCGYGGGFDAGFSGIPVQSRVFEAANDQTARINFLESRVRDLEAQVFPQPTEPETTPETTLPGN